MAKVRQALDIINSQISQFPPGTPLHTELMKAVEKLTKHMPPSDAALGVNNTALRDLQQNSQKNAMLQMVQQSLGAGGAQGGAPSPLGAPNPQGA